MSVSRVALHEQGPTFSMVVPAPFFEMASDAWEESALGR